MSHCNVKLQFPNRTSAHRDYVKCSLSLTISYAASRRHVSSYFEPYCGAIRSVPLQRLRRVLRRLPFEAPADGSLSVVLVEVVEGPVDGRRPRVLDGLAEL